MNKNIDYNNIGNKKWVGRAIFHVDINSFYSSCEATSNTKVNEYAKLIKKTIKENCDGLSTSIGVATTKSVAKIASDYQKPDGLTIVYNDELKNFLDKLEVERISGIGPKTQKILKEDMKINTIGQLAKKDVQTLIDRFGRRSGTWMWQVSNGEYDDLVVPRGDHISLSAESTLETFSGNRFEMKNFLKELVNKLYERVTNNCYQFRTVGIKLVRTNFSIETRETSYTTYKSDRKSIESVIDGLLDRFALENKSGIDDTTTSTVKILPIRKIGLKVSNLIKQDNKNFN